MNTIEQMRSALENMDDYAAMAGIDPIGPRKVLSQAIDEITEIRKQRDELLDVFRLVIAEMEHRDRNDGNAPGHGHEVPGIWDRDNGRLAGKPCAWCAVWKKAKEICGYDVKGGGA